jgi:amicyanin
MRTFRIAVALMIILVATEVRADEAVVHIENFTFNPPELTVKPGTTITWINADDIPHSVVGEKAGFRSHVLDSDEKFSMTFADAGELDYFCGLHPHMRGKIIVKP